MLKKFIDYVNNHNLCVDSIILTKNKQRYEHFFKPDHLNNIRSISKVISCLGAYKAIEYGLYSLDTRIIQFFDTKKIYNKSNLKYLELMEIKHLLCLSIGQEKGLMFSKDIKNLPGDTDYIYHILNYDIKHDPGTSFVYNNAATYLLCAITQKLTQSPFDEWLQRKLFNKMDIVLGPWEKSNQGICLGASGLQLKNQDLHKIALLLLNNGMINGKQIVSNEWIQNMRTPKIFTANLPEYAHKQGRCINKMAYGFGLWICGDGTAEYPKTHYFCDGTDGQILVVSPKEEMAITILSHQKDMNPLYDILSEYIK